MLKKPLVAVLAVLLLGAAGCANTGEAQESSSPLPTKTPIPHFPPNTMPSSIMIDDVMYCYTGIILPLNPDESEFEGRTTSIGRASRMPTRNGQANWLPEGTPYLYFSGTVTVKESNYGEDRMRHPFIFHDEEREGYAVMLENGEWILFEIAGEDIPSQGR